MNGSHRQTTFTSKFVALYTKLLQGVPPSKVDPNGNPQQLLLDLLDLKVDAAFLSGELQSLSRETCLGKLKPFLNLLFISCLRCASTAPYGDVKKDNALDTLTIFSRHCLSKNLSGWEAMELVAGSVGQSDAVFNDITSTIDTIAGDDAAPAATRHKAVQFGLVFVCTVSQLSPGAYFLRRNLFPSIVKFIKCRETEMFALDAALFLAILANYHKSDAARMNPYLKRIKECEDDDVLQRICGAVSAFIDAAVREYESSSESQGSGIVAAWNAIKRPDRFLTRMISPQPERTDASTEDQPIAEAVALLPAYEFMAGSPGFIKVMIDSLDSASKTPWMASFLNLASWIFSNASTSSSARTHAYANLVLEMLLLVVENEYAASVLCSRSCRGIQLCQKRLPRLPTARPGPPRPAISEILDCCNLWLRHNLHKRLPAHSYSKCVWICHRIIWYLHEGRIRLDYHWKELWISFMGLFAFVGTKLDSLITTGGVGQLILDSLKFLESAILLSETYLPTPQAVHELVYELVRNSESLDKQRVVLESVEVLTAGGREDDEALRSVLDITFFYNEKICSTGTNLKEASDAFRIIGQEIELHGMHHPSFSKVTEPPHRAEEVLDFARYGCGDILSLA